MVPGRDTRRERLAAATREGVTGPWNALAILGSLVLLVDLLPTDVSPEMASSGFGGWPVSDVIVGPGIEGVSTGNAMKSYVIGGELPRRAVVVAEAPPGASRRHAFVSETGLVLGEGSGRLGRQDWDPCSGDETASGERMARTIGTAVHPPVPLTVTVSGRSTSSSNRQ